MDRVLEPNDEYQSVVLVGTLQLRKSLCPCRRPRKHPSSASTPARSPTGTHSTAYSPEACGFPDFYGRNMDVWIACVSYIDDPDARMTEVHCSPGRVATIVLSEAVDFASRCPDQYAALVECTAFVNWRRLEIGEPAVLALAYNK